MTAEREEWPSYAELLAPYVERSEWLPDRYKSDPMLRQEFRRFLTFISAYGYFNGVYQDPDYPDFWPCYSTAFPIGFNNPDDVYLLTAIDDQGTYRISGHRGTVRILEIEVGSSPMQAWGEAEWAPQDWMGTLSHFVVDDDAAVREDGMFEIILSPTAPADGAAVWWELKPGAKMILVRQRAYDWGDELEGRLAIERLDVPASRPRASADVVERKVNHTGRLVQNWAWHMTQWFESLERAEVVNDLAVKHTHGGGIQDQIYAHGIFELAAEEALIVEFEVPEDCKYWMIHLTDQLMSSIDQVHRHTSINGRQASMVEGRFRAVISSVDPGVPNWLDTGGLERGGISARWWAADPIPEPVLTRIKVDEVRAHLPVTTPAITPEERDQMVRDRRRATQFRRRW